jgi:cbb3-type cytochrome oxidase cytochrome c subunit
MTTAKKAAKKTAKKAENMTTAKATPKKTKEEKPLTVEEKLDGLIAYLKAHGIHYDGSAAPEPEPEEDESKG